MDPLHLTLLAIAAVAIVGFLVANAERQIERREKEQFREQYDEMVQRWERERRRRVEDVDAADWWKPEGWSGEEE